MLKKIILSLLLAFLALGVFYKPASAEPWFKPTYKEFNDKVMQGDESEIFGERYTQAQVYWIFYSLQNVLSASGFSSCVANKDIQGIPTDADGEAIANDCVSIIMPTNPPGTEFDPPATGAYRDPGAILGLSLMIDSVRNTRVTSGVDYIAKSLHEFNLIPEAYAQGFGFQTLSASQSLWTAARNMSYGLLVLVFIAFAFAIMFRVKLSPQTVITVQSALPKIVIAMVAIWFSYAIAGLLIDLSYLIQGIVSAFIANAPAPGNPAGLSDRTVVEFLQIMNQPMYSVTSIGLIFVVLAVVVGAAGFLGGPATGGISAVAGLLTAVVLLLIFIAFVITLIKLIWLFLRTYAMVLLLVIGGPFFILGGAVGLAGGLMGWIKNITAQLSVFVSASVLIVFAHIFIWSTTNTAWSWMADWDPFNPFLINPGTASIGSATLPGFGAMDPGILGLAVGFVVLMATPSLATVIRDSLVKPMRLDLGIGATFGAMAGASAPYVGSSLGRMTGPTPQLPFGLGMLRRFGVTPPAAGGTASNIATRIYEEGQFRKKWK